jgi:hypothetical protein
VDDDDCDNEAKTTPRIVASRQRRRIIALMGRPVNPARKTKNTTTLAA